MQDLKITLVQADLAWEDIRQNLLRFDGCLSALPGKQDLVVLPEMFNTGFSVTPEPIAETPGGPTTQWMALKAKELGCVLAGSLIIKESGYYYNRMIWMRPDGSYETYDKRHLFRMGNEHLRFQPGKKKAIIDLNGWKICPIICYDLRFPVWSKNTYKSEKYQYDILLVLANWPQVRKQVWKTLLPARAMENLVYAAAVNRVGTDGHGMAYSGNTLIADAKGDILSEVEENLEGVLSYTLSYENLQDVRLKLNAGLDWDSFTLNNL